MKYIIGAVVATVFWILILNFIPAPDERVLIYDCGMSEWHPDIPAEVKEECRKRYRGRVPGVSI